MSGSDWILMALAVLALSIGLYLVVFGYWLKKYGGPRGIRREIARRLK